MATPRPRRGPVRNVVTRVGTCPPCAETHTLFVRFGIATTLLLSSVDARVQLQRLHEDASSFMLASLLLPCAAACPGGTAALFDYYNHTDARGALPALLLRWQHGSSAAASLCPAETFRQGAGDRGRQGTTALPRLGQLHPLPLAAPARRPSTGDELRTALAVRSSRLWPAARHNPIRRARPSTRDATVAAYRWTARARPEFPPCACPPGAAPSG